MTVFYYFPLEKSSTRGRGNTNIHGALIRRQKKVGLLLLECYKREDIELLAWERVIIFNSNREINRRHANKQSDSIPARWWKLRPLALIPLRPRHVMEEEIVAPVKNRPLLHSQTAAIPFVRGRRVGIFLLHVEREAKELAPGLSRALHQLRADAVVYNLKETPLAASVGYQTQSLVAEALIVAEKVLQVNDRDVNERRRL